MDPVEALETEHRIGEIDHVIQLLQQEKLSLENSLLHTNQDGAPVEPAQQLIELTMPPLVPYLIHPPTPQPNHKELYDK